MKYQYVEHRFNGASLAIIAHANKILAEYVANGYAMTLRQLYYQFVARDLIPNTPRSYKNLGQTINDARLAGLIDWAAIEDRTRNSKRVSMWDSTADIIEIAADQFLMNPWKDQKYAVEIWVEKEALSAVVERAANEWRVPYLCCRGYTSQSEVRSAALRLLGHIDDGKTPVIIHLGDHDPSGMDMSRDIEDRLAVFMEGLDDHLEFRRIALNMDQVKQYNPPPNPAKITDSRYAGYRSRFGNNSWELDALEPQVIHELINSHIKKLVDKRKWNVVTKIETMERSSLKKVAARWEHVTDFVNS